MNPLTKLRHMIARLTPEDDGYAWLSSRIERLGSGPIRSLSPTKHYIPRAKRVRLRKLQRKARRA